MTTKQNNFEGGGAAGGGGTGITTGNSGGGSGDALAIVTLPTSSTSATFTFDTTGDNPGGTFGGRWQLAGATVGGWRSYLAWTAASTQLAGRFTFCLNSLPTVNVTLACIINGSFVTNARLLYISTHTLQTTNAAGTGIGGTTAVTAGTVYVWEVQIDTGSTNANGTINSQVYALSAPGSLLINFASGAAVNAGGVSGATVEQPIRGSMGNNDVIANLDVTFDDLLFVTGTTTPVGPPSVSATVTMGSALAATTAQTAPQVMNLTSPAYAATAADLGGGPGSWVNVSNAQGAPDGSFATWTAP